MVLIGALQSSRFLWTSVAPRQAVMIGSDPPGLARLAFLGLANLSLPERLSLITQCVCLSSRGPACFQAKAWQGNHGSFSNDG